VGRKAASWLHVLSIYGSLVFFVFAARRVTPHPNLEAVIYPNLEAVIERELAPFANRTHLVVYLTTTKAVVVSSCSLGSTPGAWQGERSQRSECG
jgi:hypothetical protein